MARARKPQKRTNRLRRETTDCAAPATFTYTHRHPPLTWSQSLHCFCPARLMPGGLGQVRQAVGGQPIFASHWQTDRCAAQPPGPPRVRAHATRSPLADLADLAVVGGLGGRWRTWRSLADLAVVGGLGGSHGEGPRPKPLTSSAPVLVFESLEQLF